jgi:hypothetical protein
MFDAGKSLGKEIINGLIAGLAGVAELAADIGQEIADAVWNAIKWTWNNVVADTVNTAVRKAVDLLDSALGPFVNFGDPPNLIPRLAEGGIVTAPTLALIGEAGPEAVVPLDRADGMAGMNVVVNVSGSVTSERDLVEAIRRGLVNSQRNGSPLVYTNL